MKASVTAILSTAALLQVATANFDIYYSYVSGIVGGSDSGWQIHSTPPDCGEVDDTHVWDSSDDVSGDKRGIRCEGDGCTGDGEIKELEMNFGDDLHWTVYKDRDYEITDLQGDVHGRCMMFPDHDVECDVGPIGSYEARRRMRCLVDRDADDINSD